MSRRNPAEPTRSAWETMSTPGGGSYIYPVPQWTQDERPYVPKATDGRDPLWVRVLANAVIISALVIGLTAQARWVKRQVRKVLGR